MELRVLVSIWGSNFADVFLRWSLPSLLSHGNCQRVLAGGHHMTFYIYSDSAALESLRSSECTTSVDGKEFNFFPMFQKLLASPEVHICGRGAVDALVKAWSLYMIVDSCIQRQIKDLLTNTIKNTI